MLVFTFGETQMTSLDLACHLAFTSSEYCQCYCSPSLLQIIAWHIIAVLQNSCSCLQGNIFYMFSVCALCAALSARLIIADRAPGKRFLLNVCGLVFSCFLSTVTSNSQSVLESSPSRSGSTVRLNRYLQRPTKRMRGKEGERNRERAQTKERSFQYCVFKETSVQTTFPQKNLFTPVSLTDQTHKYKAEANRHTKSVLL